jgi:hypothetical protein
MSANAASIPATPADAGGAEGSLAIVVRRHLRFGWAAILVFLTLGLVLEALHGFKVQAYLSVMNETRRLMWTLAHAHGTLLGLANIAFAFTVHCTPGWQSGGRAVASYAIIAASLVMPGGFFLGGVWVYAGDPGLGIVLVPIGGVLLFTAVLLAALSLKHFQIAERGDRGRSSRVQGSRSR